MRLLIAIVLGFFTGILDAWFFLGNQWHDLVGSSSAMLWCVNALHMPAIVLVKLWMWLNPHGDGGYVTFPILTIIQWTIIGGLCGMYWQKMQTKEKSQPSSAGDSSTRGIS